MTSAQPKVLAVVAAGGMVGAVTRFAVQAAFPHRPGMVDWAIFAVNVSGCLLIGVLMGLVNPRQRLLTAFLGTGVLGGFTTFSAFTVDVVRMAEAGNAVMASGYLGATVASALAAVWLGSVSTAWLRRATPDSDASARW